MAREEKAKVLSMKKFLTILAIFILIASADAKGIKIRRKTFVEIGPKASLYMEKDLRFGIGAEVITNLIKVFGIRLNLTEATFGHGTEFYLNYGSSLDALFYIPMREMEPCIHAGFGFQITAPHGTKDPQISFRLGLGMGFNYAINATTKLFAEPGLIIKGVGADTKTVFRISWGARFKI